MTANRVRTSIRRAFGNDSFSHVSIQDSAIEDFADDLSEMDLPVPEWTGSPFPHADIPDETVFDLYILIAAHQFQFLIHDELYRATYDGETWTGALALWRSFADAIDRGVPITDGEHLRDLSLAETRALFTGEERNETSIPMVEERHQLCNDIGELLCTDHDRFFHQSFDASQEVQLFGNGGFVEFLTEDFAVAFGDTRTADGQTLYFDKKAQLAASTLYGRFQQNSFFTPSQEDIAALTIFADYVVPANLRAHGVLSYDSHLTQLVDGLSILPEGSREEIEIRAAAILAADRLLDAVNDRHSDHVTMPQLDYALWRWGREVDTIYHHVRTTDY